MAQPRPGFIKPDDNLVEIVWGGTYIERMKGLPPSGRRIGESWECSSHPEHPSMVRTGESARLPLTTYLQGMSNYVLGEEIAREFGDRLPILLKFIDAREDLSVQVHPSDAQARELGEADTGKDEAWFILAAEAGAVIYLGFERGVVREELEADLTSGDANIADRYLRAVPVQRGDVFFVPADTVHSIGRGVVLVEIEQASSVTYRVWDWNRKPRRPLHVRQAMQVLDFESHPESAFRRLSRRISQTEELLVDSRQFSMNRLSLGAGTDTVVDTRAGFQVLSCLAGEAFLEGGGFTENLLRGQSLIVPAGMRSYRVVTTGGVTLLKSYRRSGND